MSAEREIVIECDTPTNGNPIFPPLQEMARGRWETMRVAETTTGGFRAKWPDVIPGQRIGIDTEKEEGFIEEPLYEEQWTETKAKIEKQNVRFAPVRATKPNAHVPTWLFWMKRLVEGGNARVVKGRLPDDIGGDPKTNFLHAPKKVKPAVETKEMDEMRQQLAALKAEIAKLSQRPPKPGDK